MGFDGTGAGSNFVIVRQGTGAPKITLTTATVELGTDAVVDNDFTVHNDLTVDNDANVGADCIVGTNVEAGGDFIGQGDISVTGQAQIGTIGLIGTADTTSTYGLAPQLRVANSNSSFGGVIDIYRADSTVTGGEDAGTLQFSVQDDNKYAVAQIQVKTIAETMTGNSGGGVVEIKTAAPQSGQVPQKRISVDNVKTEIFGELISHDNLTVEGDLIANGLDSHADDAAAGAAGLVQNQLYQTDGTGAAPLNVAGIVMIKQ